jgi:hypothetical protein
MDAREYLCRKRKRDSSDCSRIEWNGMECICNCKLDNAVDKQLLLLIFV